MQQYYIGLDNGGTLTKAVMFDQNGRTVARAQRKVSMITPHPGHTERDMEKLWQANVAVLREVMDSSAVNASAVKGLSLAGHGKGLYLWGKDGRPCWNGIVSTDSRALEYPAQWNRDGTADRVFNLTCQSILASQPVSLLRWFKDHEPGVYRSIAYVFEVKDYIRFRLTGEAWAEITDYSGANLVNLHTRAYDEELLALFGLEDISSALPPLRASTDVCGHITRETAAATGLPAGLPVAGGMFDIDACAIAMDITNEDNICAIAGTWSINEYISRTPVLNHSIMMNSLFCMDSYYLVEECSPTSAGNLEWYIDTFLEAEKREAAERGENIYVYCDRLAASAQQAERGIIFLPYIYGSNYNPGAKACFVGMDSSHNRADVVRAVFEGVVFSHLVHIEKLLLNRERTQAVRLGGGAANSSFWSQMFADVLGLPVEVIAVDELGALGAAMAAAVAAGTYPSLEAAANKMVSVKHRLEPDLASHEVYRTKYALYQEVSRRMDGLWVRT